MENKVMLMIDAIKDGFNRFADFSGVSTRSQYWYFILGTSIASVIAQVSFGDLGGNLVSLITLIPTINVPRPERSMGVISMNWISNLNDTNYETFEASSLFI